MAKRMICPYCGRSFSPTAKRGRHKLAEDGEVRCPYVQELAEAFAYARHTKNPWLWAWQYVDEARQEVQARRRYVVTVYRNRCRINGQPSDPSSRFLCETRREMVERMRWARDLQRDADAVLQATEKDPCVCVALGRPRTNGNYHILTLDGGVKID